MGEVHGDRFGDFDLKVNMINNTVRESDQKVGTKT